MPSIGAIATWAFPPRILSSISLRARSRNGSAHADASLAFTYFVDALFSSPLSFLPAATAFPARWLYIPGAARGIGHCSPGLAATNLGKKHSWGLTRH